MSGTVGALDGVRVVMLAGAGPSPYAGMVFTDLGAEVIRVDRPGEAAGVSGLGPEDDTRARGVRAICVDLKHPQGVEVVRRLQSAADVFVDPYRPGVVERLGVGAGQARALNPRLVYVHATGWGHDGDWAERPGHDINYLGLTGLLWPLGPPEGAPSPPMNLLADFGGGSHLVIGVLAALFRRDRTGQGAVVDAAMVDAVNSLGAMYRSMRAVGAWSDDRGANLFDGGAPFYGCYETADGGYLAVGAMEAPFYQRFVTGLGLDPEDYPQYERRRWPQWREDFAAAVRGRSRSEWEAVFVAGDGCVTPVLTPDEAVAHPALASRGALDLRDGVAEPAASPRVVGPGVANPATASLDRAGRGAHTDAVLYELGYIVDEIDSLRADAAVR